MYSNAEMQLIYKVANAPIQMFPYLHIMVGDVFPANFYQEMRRHLPPSDAYKSLKAMGRVAGDYPETRGVLPLTPDAVATLAEPYRSFWERTASWLLGGQFGQVVLQKFGPLLALRYENPAAVRFNHEVLVVQDRTNYSLGPHTDSPAKVLSLLLYLPADDSMPHLGTSMYLPKDPDFTCPGGPQHAFANFDRLLTVPYVPNSLFCFMKTANAFHGVEPIAELNVERALIIYDIKFEYSALAPTQAVSKPHTQFSF